MSRLTTVLDRAAALVLGLVLLGAGAAAVAWPVGWLDRLWPSVPQRLTTQPGLSAVDQPWWPWACGTAGLLAVLAGARWLLAHLPPRRVGAVLLSGSGRAGRLLLVPAGPAGVAAEVLAETPGVRSAHGRMIRERGATVISIDAVAEPHADLTDIATAGDAVAADLRKVIGRDDITIRIALSIASRRRSMTRVD